MAIELTLTARVRASANPGGLVTLTVIVRGKDQSPAEALIVAPLGQPGNVTLSGSALPPVSIPGSVVTTPGNLSNLFPVVSPTGSRSPAAGRRAHADSLASIVPTASTLPLDPRLIGGQLIGLAVLAAAIAMVVTRLSLRKPPASTGGSEQSGQAQ